MFWLRKVNYFPDAPDLPEYGEDEPDGEQGDGDNEDAGKERRLR